MTREEFKEYEKSAETGDMFSIYVVGEAYFTGCIVEKNPAKAYEYHHKAALLGYPPAVVSTGLDLIAGIGVKKDAKKGLEYLKSICNLYEDGEDNLDDLVAEASYYIGAGYLDGEFGLLDKDRKAMPYFERASKLGYAKAQLLLSQLYYIGKGTPHDLDKSIFWATCAYLHGKNSPEESAKGREKLEFFVNHGLPKDYVNGIIDDVKCNYKNYIVNP